MQLLKTCLITDEYIISHSPKSYSITIVSFIMIRLINMAKTLEVSLIVTQTVVIFLIEKEIHKDTGIPQMERSSL